MSILKLSYTLAPFTLAGLRNGTVGAGDILVPVEDVPSFEGKDKLLFREDIEYPILEVWPNVENAEGVILKSELGKWYIHFNSPNGGYQYFKVEELDPEEQLGQLQQIPANILKLFGKYLGKPLRRKDIISEMQHWFYDKNPQARAQLREDTERALKLLESAQMILPGEVIGTYILSQKGKDELGLPSEISPEKAADIEREKQSRGKTK